MGALATDTHRFGGMSDRPAFDSDTVDNQQTTLNSQPGITVRHEDLLVLCEDGYLHTARRSSPVQGPVTNLSAQYI